MNSPAKSTDISKGVENDKESDSDLRKEQHTHSLQNRLKGTINSHFSAAFLQKEALAAW